MASSRLGTSLPLLPTTSSDDSSADESSSYKGNTWESHDASQPTSNQPPSLDYSLWERKTSIAITWSIILTQACICPIVLYYTLHNFTDLETRYIFTIISLITAIAAVQLGVRFWKLWQPSDELRPDDAGRWGVDIFQIEYAFGVVIISIIWGVGIATGPNLRIVSLPVPVLVAEVGLQMVLSAPLAWKGVQVPVRISTPPAGSAMRPALYYIVEDIVAVDGGAGKAYRRTLNQRYLASPIFRKMIAELNLFWGVMGSTVGIVMIVLIAAADAQVAYGLAWGVPWLFAGVWAWATVRWIGKRLTDEREHFSGTSVCEEAVYRVHGYRFKAMDATG